MKKNLDKENSVVQFIQSKSFVKKLLIILSFLFLLGWLILVTNENRLSKLNLNAVTQVDTTEYSSFLEVAAIADNHVNIQGWVIKNGESIKSAAIKVVLRDIDKGIYYVLPTEIENRKDVTEYMNDGNNYDYCGFYVRIPYWKKLKNKDYEIFALCEMNNTVKKLVPLNKFLKGEDGVTNIEE